MSDLYAQPGHLVWRAAARVDRLVDEILPGTADIHAYAALLGLADQEPQSQQSLARMIAVSGTTMTSVAELLQRDGLVARVRNPADRRSYSLTRTPAGRSAVRRWTPHVVRLEERLTTSFTSQDAVRLQEVLRRVAAGQLDERTPAGAPGEHRLPRHAGAPTRAPRVPDGPAAPRHRAAALRQHACAPRGRARDPGAAGRPSGRQPRDRGPDGRPPRAAGAADPAARQRRPPRLPAAPHRAAARASSSRPPRPRRGVQENWVGGPRSRDRRDLVRLLTLLLTDAAHA